ncbi:DNA internalization-related competence protein ComEC/Rec2 [Rosenbergiella nectarea]|uniref:DNA internalization-related competence protein ComEC/Rec2 n=1 Tax=Rosenbergiella nectarea TaxID=988801 RepID=UPI001F4E770D|nr:DNA internalization-related competence protein ComEC/Rec2 [Rosenbergiella nectarea]
MQCIPYALLIILACLPLCFISVLPDRLWVVCGIIAALYLIRRPSRVQHYLGFLILFGGFGLLTAHSISHTLSSLSEQTLSAEVTISELHRQRQKMQVSVNKVNGHWQFPAYKVWIHQVESDNYCPGQRWLMTLRVRPVHSLLNEGGYDSQRNALAKDALFTGKIIEENQLTASCSIRFQLEHLFMQNTLSSPWQGISRALVFGLRDRISDTTNRLFRETGIGHLMAISGMHIGLVFWLTHRGWSIVARLCHLLPIESGWRELGGWLFSGSYCYLSGMQPSAMRAMFALTFWLIAKRYAVNLSSIHILILCVASLLAINPLMVLSDSLWLSALAVLALLLWYRWFPLPPVYRQGKRYFIFRLLHLQMGLMILLLPIQIFFFQGISLTALGANLVAIPLVSVGILPISLLLVVPWPDLAYRALLFVHDGLYTLLFTLLTRQEGGWVVLTNAPWIAGVVWGGLIAGRFYWWRHFPISLGAMVISLLSWRVQLTDLLWRIDMLDVGHGLAVVISQQGEGIIYDTGNRWQVGDAGERIIIPWLGAQRITPVAAIISHRHSDHSGGLQSIKKRWPTLPVRTSYRYPRSLPCQRGERWQWGRLSIRVLWPENAKTAGQNNDSCVLYISDGQHHLLLTGDIEKEAEQRLIELEKGGIPITWLQVPHHGSRTSSSSLFLRKLNPDIAFASVARYNAWRLPAKTVVKRYRSQGIDWVDTAQAGQISIRVRREGTEVLQYRDQISPRWYHQWFGVKPDYR